MPTQQVDLIVISSSRFGCGEQQTSSGQRVVPSSNRLSQRLFMQCFTPDEFCWNCNTCTPFTEG